MAIKLMDTMETAGDFPLIQATDVGMTDGTRLQEYLEEQGGFMAGAAGEVTAQVASLTQRVDDLEEQDQIFAAAAETVVGQMASLTQRVDELEENSGSAQPGVISWNDLTDKPFGDNEDGSVTQLDNKYLAILDSPDETDLISEQDVAFAYTEDAVDYPAYFGQVGSGITMEEGKTYLVQWDGEVHALVCRHYDALIGTVCSLGNLGLIYEAFEDTGEDFALMSIDIGAATAFYTSDSAASHRIRVYYASDTGYKVKKEYLPEESGLSGLPAVTADDNGKIIQVVDGKWEVVRPSGLDGAGSGYAAQADPPEDTGVLWIDTDDSSHSGGSETYTREEIDAALGSYITDIDTLIGGDA